MQNEMEESHYIIFNIKLWENLAKIPHKMYYWLLSKLHLEPIMHLNCLLGHRKRIQFFKYKISNTIQDTGNYRKNEFWKFARDHKEIYWRHSERNMVIQIFMQYFLIEGSSKSIDFRRSEKNYAKTRNWR